MNTLASCFKHDAAYWGERGDWLVVYTRHRDSDCLARSNWRTFIRELGGTGTGEKGSEALGEQLAIEEAGHWAVGWVQYLVVHPAAAELITKAEEILAGLESYPVVDENDFSELEWSEYQEAFASDAASEFRRAFRNVEMTDAERDEIEEAPVSRLQEWFEAKIPSGDVQQDGYPNFHYAFRDLSRDDADSLLAAIRRLSDDAQQLPLQA